MKGYIFLLSIIALIGFITILSEQDSFGHKDGCHRWHSCPSDSGSYTCGDAGYCSECPDNNYCKAGQPYVQESDYQSTPSYSEPVKSYEPPKKTTPKAKTLSIKTECNSNTLKGKITNPDVDSAKIFILNSAGSIIDTKEAKNGEFFIKNFNQHKKVKVSANGFDTLIQDLKCDSKVLKKDTKSKDARPITKVQPRIKIIGMLEGNMPNQYIVGFDICAGSDRLEKPQLEIITDIQTFKPITFPAIIGSNSCVTYDYTVKANDPKSINIDFYKTDDSEKIAKLEKELAELKKMLKDSQK